MKTKETDFEKKLRQAGELQMSITMGAVLNQVRTLQHEDDETILGIASQSLIEFVEASDNNQIKFLTNETGGAILGLATLAALMLFRGMNAKLDDEKERVN
jgi:hypothetical protein